MAAVSLGPAGCGLAHLVVEGACTGRSLDPWTDDRGLPVEWLEDEEIVAGSMCASRDGPGSDRPEAGGAEPERRSGGLRV